jgi:hypothetical protein
VLLHIFLNGQAGASHLVNQLGYSFRELQRSLDRLIRAKLLAQGSKGFKIANRKAVFSLKRIVAIEVKIGERQKVFEQSLRNKWFASHSYALIDSKQPTEQTQKRFADNGLGLYCGTDSFDEKIKAQKGQLPACFVSLLFNEWLGRLLTRQEYQNDYL